MLTAKDSEIDKVAGLEIGADDYVTKPYPSGRAAGRIKAALRRLAEPEELLPLVLEVGRSAWTSSDTLCDLAVVEAGEEPVGAAA